MAAKKATEKPVKMGPPTKYTKKLLPVISSLVLRGLTDKEIAECLDIGAKTLYRWRIAHEELRQTLQRSKEIVNEQVEATLIKKALGFTETVIEASHGKKVEYDKTRDPELGAIKLYLQHRMPDVYKAKIEQTNIHSVDEAFQQACLRMNAKVEGDKRKARLEIDRENAEDVEVV